MQNNNKPLNKSSPILVTGASGYLASHLIKLLLERDFKVRGTVRSLANKENYDFLSNLVPEKRDNLELVEASLEEKSGWQSAVEGCEYVFHVASPIPKNTAVNDEDFVKIAVNGTSYILEASLEKGVKKVVMTSSAATMAFGNPSPIINEDEWADEKVCHPYALSKLKAERLVWDFYEHNKDKIQVAVLNPVIVLGPVFNNFDNTSVSILGDMLAGTASGVMDLTIGMVDVRDVAEAHFQAMFRDEANGKRYLISGVDAYWGEIIRFLKEEFGKKGFDICDKPVTQEEIWEKGSNIEKTFAPLIELSKKYDNQRSVKDLSLTFHSLKETVIDSANSLIEYGVVSRPKHS